MPYLAGGASVLNGRRRWSNSREHFIGRAEAMNDNDAHETKRLGHKAADIMEIRIFIHTGRLQVASQSRSCYAYFSTIFAMLLLLLATHRAGGFHLRYAWRVVCSVYEKMFGVSKSRTRLSHSKLLPMKLAMKLPRVRPYARKGLCRQSGKVALPSSSKWMQRLMPR